MAKVKISNKFVKENFSTRIYCNNTRLLYYLDCRFYNCGVYGWNYDLYEYNGVALLYGDRNIPYNYRSYEIEQKYISKFENINKANYTYNEIKKLAFTYLEMFINEVTKERR